MTFKEWTFTCESCDKKLGWLCWDHELDKQVCPACNAPVVLYIPERSKAPGIVTDDFPGGVEIRHLSNKPERFYSKTEIKRACNERGWTQLGDTPKKYRVPWSGRAKDGTDQSSA